MKKKVFISLLAVLLIAALLAGCSASDKAVSDPMAVAPQYANGMPNPESMVEVSEGYGYDDDFAYTADMGGNSISEVIASASRTYNLDTENMPAEELFSDISLSFFIA